MKLRILLLALLCSGIPVQAHATQQFAKETMLLCSSCHTATMGLTPLGKSFRNSNFRLFRLTPDGAPAMALRGQGAYTSEPDPTGLPKGIVDEIDDFLAGQIADNWTYFAEVYNVDGGRPGSAREEWLEYASDRQRSPSAWRVSAGLLTLPTPVDPESFRELNQNYAVWDQTVGNNSFTFFDPHNAVIASGGDTIRGLSVSVAAVERTGIDTMLAVKDVAGPLVVDGYRYDGRSDTGTISDVFSRTGLGLSLFTGRLQTMAFAQRGMDSSFDGSGAGMSSGGGFLQTRYQISDKLFAIARYDGIQDSGGTFERTLTVGAGTSLGSHFRIEAEDVVEHVPQTTHTLNVTAGFGFSNVAGSQAY